MSNNEPDYKNNLYFPRRLANGLSKQQTAVCELLIEGCSNKEIAYKLGISISTVKLHVNAALRITGTTNRLGLAMWYLKNRVEG